MSKDFLYWTYIWFKLKGKFPAKICENLKIVWLLKFLMYLCCLTVTKNLKSGIFEVFSILSIKYLNQPMLLHQMCRNFLILQFEIIVYEILRITIHTIWFLTNLNFSQRQNVFLFGICDIGCHYFKMITSAKMYFYV